MEARLRGEIMNLLDEARNHALSDYRNASDPSSMSISSWPPVDQLNFEVETRPTLETQPTTQPTQILETSYEQPPPSPHPEFSLELSNLFVDLSQETNDVVHIQNDSGSRVRMSGPDSSDNLTLHRASSNRTDNFSFQNASSATSNIHMSGPNSSENLTLDRTSSNRTDTSSLQNISMVTDPASQQGFELPSNFDFLDDLGPNYQKSIDLDPFTVAMPWDTSAGFP
jgi:hypothetical protein